MHRAGGEPRLRRYIAVRPGSSRERGDGDILGRRARRARMSFGLGGIARELIYLVRKSGGARWRPPYPALTICRRRWR
ncbi:hypothetical protein GGD65_000764 [Bradyrhizobium sp. CIR18]|nr:hypothetical protein [Bradyrhizobium sp. CIR18]